MDGPRIEEYASPMFRLLVCGMTLLFGVAATPAMPMADSWSVVRYDTREFCPTSTLTWDLKAGRMSIAEGECDPHGAAPPTITSKPILPYDLVMLRILSKRALREGMARHVCRTVAVRPFAGPLYFVVTKGAQSVRSPDCFNALGVRLDEALTASLRSE